MNRFIQILCIALVSALLLTIFAACSPKPDESSQPAAESGGDDHGIRFQLGILARYLIVQDHAGIRHLFRDGIGADAAAFEILIRSRTAFLIVVGVIWCASLYFI